MNNIYVMNCGGLCNRINNFINGIYIGNRLNRNVVIVWPVNNQCNCRFDDIFQNDLEVQHIYREPISLDDYNELFGDGCQLYKKKWEPLGKDSSSIKRLRQLDGRTKSQRFLEEIRRHGQGILLQASMIFDLVPPNERLNTLGDLVPAPEISKRIEDFVRENRIDRSVIGMHLRRTDLSTVDDAYFVRIIRSHISKDPTKKVFVCSDSRQTEQNLKTLFPKTVIIHDKMAYPQKRNEDLDWTVGETDANKYNVHRSKNSVSDAVIDLFILAKTHFAVHSVGSFSNVAYCLSLIQGQNRGFFPTMIRDFKVRHYTSIEKFLRFFNRIPVGLGA